MSISKDKVSEVTPGDMEMCSVAGGTVEKIPEDIEVCNFYGESISDSYRLKSELVGRCMQEIGMGPFQWKLFVFCGFGGLIDNLWV